SGYCQTARVLRFQMEWRYAPINLSVTTDRASASNKACAHDQFRWHRWAWNTLARILLAAGWSRTENTADIVSVFDWPQRHHRSADPFDARVTRARRDTACRRHVSGARPGQHQRHLRQWRTDRRSKPHRRRYVSHRRRRVYVFLRQRAGAAEDCD